MGIMRMQMHQALETVTYNYPHVKLAGVREHSKTHSNYNCLRLGTGGSESASLDRLTFFSSISYIVQYAACAARRKHLNMAKFAHTLSVSGPG
jgi:hypothetical protein